VLSPSYEKLECTENIVNVVVTVLQWEKVMEAPCPFLRLNQWVYCCVVDMSELSANT